VKTKKGKGVVQSHVEKKKLSLRRGSPYYKIEKRDGYGPPSQGLVGGVLLLSRTKRMEEGKNAMYSSKLERKVVLLCRGRKNGVDRLTGEKEGGHLLFQRQRKKPVESTFQE